GSPYVAGLNCRVVVIDGYPRRFVVHVPTALILPPPVVIMLHGSNGSGEGRYDDSGWKEKADAEGFVAVFPTGLSYKDTIDNQITTHWNSPDVVLQIDPKWRPHG